MNEEAAAFSLETGKETLHCILLRNVVVVLRHPGTLTGFDLGYQCFIENQGHGYCRERLTEQETFL